MFWLFKRILLQPGLKPCVGFSRGMHFCIRTSVSVSTKPDFKTTSASYSFAVAMVLQSLRCVQSTNMLDMQIMECFVHDTSMFDILVFAGNGVILKGLAQMSML